MLLYIRYDYSRILYLLSFILYLILEATKMLYPPVADLLKNVESRYLLVNLVAHRARQIAAEAEAFQEDLPEKPVTMAIREVADGELTGYVKEEYKH